MKAVFDTNVLIAACVAEGLCARLLGRARKGHFDLLLCLCIIVEFQQVLRRKFKAGEDELAQAVALLTEASLEIIAPALEVNGICRDADDDRLLACAKGAGADYLVTGDDDLLVLRKYDGIMIISPEFSSCFLATDRLGNLCRCRA